MLIDDFAVRSFREVADLDYICARLAYRSRLVPQFLWSSLQAIEKYLKCILLLNRIKATNLRHDLGRALKLIEQHAPFELRLRKPSRQLIDHLDTYGRFRYLETPFHVMGLEIMQLDMAVWDVRRYCRRLDYEIKQLDGSTKQMLDIELQTIKYHEQKPPHSFRIIGGLLEKIIDDRKHPAREGLIWQNLFFGKRRRKKVRLAPYMHSTNSPLSLHPEILNDVLSYVFLPKDVVDAYRRELSSRASATGSGST